MGLPAVLPLTALFYLPWLPHLRAQLEAGGPAYLQSAVPSLPGIAAVLWGDLARFGAADDLDEMSRGLLVLRAASVALVFVSYCLGCWRWSSRGGQGMKWLLIANSILAVVFFAGVCLMRGGMWSPKALMPAGLCALGLAATGLSTMRLRGIAVGLSALLIVSGAYGVWIDKTTLEKTQWREVAQYLRMHAEQDDIMITTERYCLRSYEPGLARIMVTVPRSHEEPDLQMLLSRQLSTVRRVWVVRSDPDAHVAEYLSTLGSHAKTWEHGWIKLNVSLWRKRS
ncbi:MAG: hypothetical protein HPY44_12970 [Armatimonadetes bacterium]|nr:hypothetical protein [Armatimonadota bacterium]